MKKREKILALVMVMVFFAGQSAYARWQDAFGFRSGPKLLQRKMQGAYNAVNRNKIGNKLMSPVKFSARASSATVSSVRKSSVGKSTIDWAKRNKGNIAVGAAGVGATIAGGPVMGVAVGTGVATAKSKVFRGWVSNMFGGGEKISTSSRGGVYGAGVGMASTRKMKVRKY